MSIKNYLPSDFNNWDWEKSNGQATAEQTATAYKAITEQGDCLSFSHLVWNDIVDLLNNALTGCGLTWDETYSSLEDAKVSGSNEPLTAKAFNSVRKNISIIYNTWGWKENKDFKGYIGRLDFKGYSEVGNNADTLYGSYIVELTQKLVELINILKNDIDSVELSALQAMVFTADAVLHACESLSLLASGTIISSSIAEAEQYPASDLFATGIIRSGALATLAKHLAAVLKGAVEIQSDSIGNAESYPSKEIASTDNMRFLHTAIADKGIAVENGSISHSKFSYEASTDKGKAKGINSEAGINFTHEALLVAGFPAFSKSEVIAEFVSDATIEKGISKAFDTICSILFTSDSSLSVHSGQDLAAVSEIDLRADAELDIIKTSEVETVANIQFSSYANLVRWAAPIKKEKGLLIRQVYSAIQTDKGLEVK